jgi:predicted aspartyl protease
MGFRRILPLVLLLALRPAAAMGADAEPAAGPDELAEIVVEGHGPRFVAPTTRDSIGRIWAPAYIDGRGPFRLVLDTGASQSVVTAELAAYLGYALDQSQPMLLHGVTGSARVPTIRVKSLTVGEMTLDGPVLPIVPDAMGGAEGILGTAGLLDKRILIDFRHDRITITYSHGERARGSFTTVPFHFLRGRLIVFDVTIGNVRAKAILDSGGQVTVANLALRNALEHHRLHVKSTPSQVVGATRDVQDAENITTPPIEFGPIRISTTTLAYVDAHIFTLWHLTDEPTVLVGMDVIGRLDTLIIDFRRRELQLRTVDD